MRNETKSANLSAEARKVKAEASGNGKSEKENYWVKCESIEDGQFEGEKLITIKDIDGKTKSAICQEELVDVEHERVKIEVIKIEEEDRRRPALIKIPSGGEFFADAAIWIEKHQIMRKFSVVLDNASIVRLKRLRRWQEIKMKKHLDEGDIVAAMIDDLYRDLMDDRTMNGETIEEIDSIR